MPARRIRRLLLPFALLFAGGLFVCALCGCAAAAEEAAQSPMPSASPANAASPAQEFAPEAEASLMISELSADNETHPNAGFSDWIELFNTSDGEVDLSDYYISRDRFHPYECRLPGLTLEAGGFLVLDCGEEIPFNLPKEGGEVVVTLAGGQTSDLLSYPALAPNESYAAEGVCAFMTPGFPNTEEGYAAYRASLPRGLVINEVLSKNGGAFSYNGALPDAIELKNLSGETIDLSDYYLSDDADDLFLWRLPEIALEPGGVYVVPATGDSSGACFKIGADGEALYLTGADGRIADALLVPPLESNVSYGRAGEFYAVFQPPSIGADNAEGRSAPLQAPEASVAPGMYEGPVELTLSGEGEIYYTLNGAEPSRTRGRRYDGTPIQIAATLAVRARAYDGEAASAPVAFNYFIGEPDYALPVLKLTAPRGTITGGGSIYENYLGSREVRANLSLFIDGREEFSINCGVSIFGAGSRELPKKSFRVKFRKIYGAGSLEYDMFPGLGVSAFDALVLRSGSEDQARALFRDELMTSLVGRADMDTLHVQAYRPVDLYINEQYFGIYFVREWVREGYVASHLNTSPESVSVIEGWDYAIRGDGETWFELLDYCRKNGDLSDDGKCAYALARIDENSLMDYYIARAYGGDHDFANIRHIRSSEGDGKWRVVFFDLDWAFTEPPARNPFTILLGARKNLRGHNNVVMRALLTNASFRARFLARVGYALSTAFASENVLARIDEMERELEADMPYECARWRRSMDGWREQVERLRDFVRNGAGRAADRAGLLAADAVDVFDMTEGEVALYFGQLTIEN